MTRDVLQALVDAGDHAGLAAAMGEPLTFGTAGIRGEVGPGSGRMNRATVIRTTSGLAAHLVSKHDGPPERPVALGFDARPDSRNFAEDTAGVLAAAGIAVRFFPEVTPTPLVAFAAKHLEAPAAVVITASHNPPADNGYKVYDGNAAQIIPPTDIEIADAIADVGSAAEVPRIERCVRRRFRPGHPDARRHRGCLRERAERSRDPIRRHPIWRSSTPRSMGWAVTRWPVSSTRPTTVV